MAITETKYLRAEKRRLVDELDGKIECKSQVELRRRFNVTLTPLGQLYDEGLRADPDMIFEDTGYACRVEVAAGAEQRFKKALYGGYLRSKWGHFITESIARLWALQGADLADFDCILFFADADTRPLNGNFRQLFELLGIADKVVVASEPVEVEELVVADLGYEHDRYYTPAQAQVYKKIIAAALHRPGSGLPKVRKIFLSRGGVSGAMRNGVNLSELESYFAANGYTLIRPEQTSLAELIQLMAGADEIATIEGSLAHNYAFVENPAAKKLIIIERHGWVNSFQVSLNKMMGLEPIGVDGYYLPRPASSQDGLMLFAPTPQFCAFAADNGMSRGGKFVGSGFWQRWRELHRFMVRYRRYCCSGDALCDWEIDSGSAILEALIASRERYGEWLAQGLPLMWFDYMLPRALVRLLRAAAKRP